MLALVQYRAGLCKCGHDLNESTTHETWDALLPLRCHACTAIAIAQDNSNRPQPSALRWGAKRRG
jgi:hypothetical protein